MSEGIGSIGVSSTWHGSMSFCVVDPLESLVDEVDEVVGASVVVPSVVVPSVVPSLVDEVGASVVEVTSELSLSLPLPPSVVVVIASVVVVVIPCDAEVMLDMLSPSLAEALVSSPLQALRTRAQAQRVVPRACVGGIDRRISAPG
jgi:hypothetical protein